MVRIIGIDPGLRNTGWGVISQEGSRLTYIADGAIHSDGDASLAERLLQLHSQLADILREFDPDEAAVEETFVNTDARATLKLGQARGVLMLAPAMLKLPVAEYAPNTVKKAVVGAGHAEKDQVKHMVKLLLPKARMRTADSTDALAVAICHAHYRGSQRLADVLARS
ncbi:crossover junction endodeoxyribonuclease RuvC [Aestuariivirga litoralis]|uniref:Crossover junction endodeoxyribonuclease RuvC n=1 Tax=Aestuariivirga litoralis TaxID=2650924 RepID=A0A2W2B0V6_9HYPH|nr:crossover junction endodeoxyribonuclease RuvC [Aestuariivirga litoralis]PZF78550.1 crossover junction endodeoxyribonuclease RuvC [Aestuariivirga litoralis]